LGLAIVKRTADLLKLRIGLHSTPGTRVGLFGLAAAGTRTQIMTAQTMPEQNANGATKAILVIDDDADVLDSMRLLLSSWGHRVVAVASLEQALHALQNLPNATGVPPFDLILSDFRLAENVSGVDVVRAVRQACGYDIPAVVITGDTSVDSINSITGAQLEGLLESRDEYTAERVFWVPPEARWQNLQNQAARPDIATLIDDAILAVERDNPNLKGKLPRDYARRGIAPEKMKGLIDLIANIGFVMVVHPSVPAKTVQEFVQLARSHSRPLNMSSGSSMVELIGEQFKTTTGTKNIVSAAYKAPARS